MIWSGEGRQTHPFPQCGQTGCESTANPQVEFKMPSAKYGLLYPCTNQKSFVPMLKIEILNRPPTTLSKLMESEDPEEPT